MVLSGKKRKSQVEAAESERNSPPQSQFVTNFLLHRLQEETMRTGMLRTGLNVNDDRKIPRNKKYDSNSIVFCLRPPNGVADF